MLNMVIGNIVNASIIELLIIRVKLLYSCIMVLVMMLIAVG
jgi:hypothetical protein